MFKIQEIREIIKLVDASSIDEFVYEVDGAKVKLKKKKQSKNNGFVSEIQTETVVQQIKEELVPVVPVAPTEKAPEVKIDATPTKKEEKVETNLHKITSPMVGTFYKSPTPDAPAFLKVGDQVNEDTVCCIVEAMKLFNEIEAEVKGEIVEVLVNDGQLVEYGQPLFLVKA